MVGLGGLVHYMIREPQNRGGVKGGGDRSLLSTGQRHDLGGAASRLEAGEDADAIAHDDADVSERA